MTDARTAAREAAAEHTLFIEGCAAGNNRNRIERILLDPTIDPTDVRYGHGDYLYAPKTTFVDWMRHHAQRAMTFTATHDLMREIVLTQQMLDEEEIDWVPLRPNHLPAPNGFMLFPYGVECPKFMYGETSWNRWMVDGFMWLSSTEVAKDGVAGEPSDGVVVFLLTRERGRDGDRPFHPTVPVPVGTIVASDLTGWAYDPPGATSWDDMTGLQQQWADEGTDHAGNAEFVERLEQVRWWVRSLMWASWRWTTEEVWLSPDLDRATRRRLLRAKPVIHENTPEDGQVVVVDLRPERKEAVERGDAAGEPPWWRSRWLVRGHWARRRYAIKDTVGTNVGPVRGAGAVEGVTFEYRHVWIEPYEKGPDNAPLVLRDKVGVVHR